MNIRSTLLGGAALAAATFAFTPALADEPAGSLGASYSYVDTSGGSADNFAVEGTFVTSISDHWQFQGVGQYNSMSGGGINADVTVINAAVAYRGSNGRLGITAGYGNLDAGGFGSGDGILYGVFGEYYGDKVTFSGKVGQFDPSGASNVTYVGANLTGYVNDNWALTGQVNYFDVSGGNLTTATAQAEYKFDNSPFALAAYYTYADVSGGGGNANVFGVQLKVYFGGAAGGSIQNAHQTGVDTFAVTPGLRYAF